MSVFSAPLSPAVPIAPDRPWTQLFSPAMWAPPGRLTGPRDRNVPFLLHTESRAPSALPSAASSHPELCRRDLCILGLLLFFIFPSSSVHVVGARPVSSWSRRVLAL